MPSTPKSRKEIFSQCFRELDRAQTTYLFTLGEKPTSAAVSDLDRKARDDSMASARGVSKVWAFNIQVLRWLKEEGVDLSKFKIDDNGWITEFPDLPK